MFCSSIHRSIHLSVILAALISHSSNKEPSPQPPAVLLSLLTGRTRCVPDPWLAGTGNGQLRLIRIGSWVTRGKVGGGWRWWQLGAWGWWRLNQIRALPEEKVEALGSAVLVRKATYSVCFNMLIFFNVLFWLCHLFFLTKAFSKFGYTYYSNYFNWALSN